MKLLKNIKIFHIVIFVCILNFLVRVPFASIYFNFDEFIYYSAYESILSNKLNPFIEYFSYKPPLMFWIPAALSYFIGANQIIPRLTIYLYSSLLLFFVYLIGRDIFKNEKVGLWSIVILFFYPLFMVQSLVFQDTIPTSLFFTMSFYFLYTSKFKWYILSSILLIMNKEIGLIPIGVFALFDLFVHKRGLIQTIKLHSPAIITFGIWMLLNKYYFGWYLWPTNVGYFDIKVLFTSFYYSKIYNFFINGFIIIFSIFAINQKNKEYKKFFYLFLIIFLINGLFASCVAFSQRYWFFPVPILIILFVNSVLAFIEKKYSNKVLIIILILINMNHFYNFNFNKGNYDSDNDLSFFKNVDLNIRAVKSAEKMCFDGKCKYLFDYHFMKATMNVYLKNYNNMDCSNDEENILCIEEVNKNKETIVAVIRYDGLILDFLLNNNFKLYEKKCDKNIFGEETAECYKIYVRYVNN